MYSNYGEENKHWDLQVLKLFSRWSNFGFVILDGSKEDLPNLETVFENEKTRTGMYSN
jgi:hypothetical protein